MRIYPERVAAQLKKGLSSVYLVFGPEPLLVHETLTQITNKAKQDGFEEIHRYQVDTSIDWDSIYDQCQALSLFSSRQIIEIALPETGANAATANHLIEVSQSLNPDILLIVHGSKLTKAQENSKWFKALNSEATLVTCLTPDLNRLPQFIRQRCSQLGLVPDQESLKMLAQWHEGNLLALVQNLEKLILLYPDGQLTLIRLEESLSRHNHYTVFHWTDALLQGKPNRGQRILRQLKAEGIEATILLRSIQKELLLLWQLNSKPQNQLASEFERLRIWNNKRPLYQAALNRLNSDKIQDLIKQLTAIEILVKTQYSDPPWLALEQLSLDLSYNASKS
ncbi:DNA polymerase III subunit delta [Vibrio sp. RC27]